MHDSAPELSKAEWLLRLVSRGTGAVLLMVGLCGMLSAGDATPKQPEVLHRRMLASDLVEADPRALAVVDGSKREFSGRVVDADGQPVAGVDVHAWDWLPGNETHTAADGTFRLAGFDPNITIEVRFMKEGFAPYTVIRQPLGTLVKPLVLDTQTYWEGVVTGPDGQPVANALIRADQGPQCIPSGVCERNIWTETHSDSQGRYKLLVQDDAYDLEVRAPGGLVARRLNEDIAPKKATALDFKLEPGVVFRARAVGSETGSPVAGAILDSWIDSAIKGTSDTEGNLRIEGLFPGEFVFRVAAKGYARWWSEECWRAEHRRRIGEEFHWQRNFDNLEYDLHQDMDPVTITFEKAVRIRGRIVDPNGKPVAGATADVVLTEAGNSLTGDTRFSVLSKADGSFEMSVPASGDREYNLMAHDGRYGQWRNWANGVNEPFRTKPGQEIEGVELRLTVPATIQGRVVDREGHPLAGRIVLGQAADFHETNYYDPVTRTDADGHYEIKFIRPGAVNVQDYRYPLRARQEPGPQHWAVEIKEGQTLPAPDLILPQ